VVFDQLWWAAAALVVIVLLDGGDPRLWLVLGAVVGIGLETKDTMVVWALALALGTVLTQGRRVLRGPWPWAGAAVAAALVAPNIVWQVLHGWPSVTFAHNLSRQTASEWPFPKLVLASLVLLGPLGVPVAGAGAVHLLRRPAVRAVGIASVVALGILLVTGGKPYYPGAIWPVLLGAGAVAAEARVRAPSSRRMAVGAVTVAAAIVLPVTLQVLPTATMARSGVVKAINPDLLETLGWPEMVGTVESVAQTLPTGERPSATVLTSNYTEASMLSVYARPGDLPVLGRQNSAWMWGRPDRLAGTVVAVAFNATSSPAGGAMCSLQLSSRTATGLPTRRRESGSSSAVTRLLPRAVSGTRSAATAEPAPGHRQLCPTTTNGAARGPRRAARRAVGDSAVSHTLMAPIGSRPAARGAGQKGAAKTRAHARACGTRASAWGGLSARLYPHSASVSRGRLTAVAR